MPRNKPHPDVYLAASKSCGIPPCKCIVCEDSLVGVTAANRAGCLCLACPEQHACLTEDYAQIRKNAQYVVSTLSEVEVIVCTLCSAAAASSKQLRAKL